MCIIAPSLDLNIFPQKHSTKDICYHSLPCAHPLPKTFLDVHSLQVVPSREASSRPHVRVVPVQLRGGETGEPI